MPNQESVKAIKEILLTPIEEKDKGKSFLVGWVSEKQIQQICSHFSKPSIKYPEKKELSYFATSDNCKDCPDQNKCQEYGYWNNYNQAIDDMKALNKEEV
jgi:hypothetical protein